MMTNHLRSRLLLSTLALTCLASTAWAGGKAFPLSRAVPEDVFIYVGEKRNPERAFVQQYWDEVWQALCESGVGPDLLALITSFMDQDDVAELNRLQEHFSKLIEEVDWADLNANEFAMGERMGSPKRVGRGGVTMMPPDIVMLFRGTEAAAPKNFDALHALMQAMADEVNKAAGQEALKIEHLDQTGVKMARMNLLGAVSSGDAFHVTLAQRGDIVFLALGDDLLGESIALLEGKSGRKSVADRKGFHDAFAALPQARDTMVFFDMQNMLAPMRKIMDIAVEMERGSDAIVNSDKQGKCYELVTQAWRVYEQKDYTKGLALAKEACVTKPDDPRALYAVACFQNLNGNVDEAKDYLHQAVAAGFYCPNHIARDPDLKSIRETDAFEKAMTLARKKAQGHHAKNDDPELEAIRSVYDRVLEVPGIFDVIATVEYTEGHQVHSHTLAMLHKNARDNAFYPVLNGGKLRQFDKFLPKETVSFNVSGGFDLDELYRFIGDSIKAAGTNGEAAWREWEAHQDRMDFHVVDDLLSWLDTEVVSVTLEGMNQSALLVKVKDQALAKKQVKTAMDHVTAMLGKAAAENPMIAMFASIRTSPVSSEKLDGFENVFVGMTPQPIVWGVADGYLIMGSSVNAIETVLDTAAGKHPNIRENEQAMSELIRPDGEFVSISLTDYRNLARDLTAMVGMISLASGMASAMIPDPQARQIVGKMAGMLAKLNTVFAKLTFYKSVASVTTFDGRAYRTHMVTNYVSPLEREQASAMAE